MTQRCVRYISTPYVRDTFTKLSEHIAAMMLAKIIS